MHIRSKVAAAVLVLGMVCLPGLAQAPQEGPPPPEQSQGPDGFGPRRMVWNMRGGEPMGQGSWGFMRGRGMGDRGMGLGRILRDPEAQKQLGITTEQAAKLRQQESDFRKAAIRDRADLEIKRMDLQDLLSADNPDRSAIDSKLNEVGAAQLALEKSAIDHRLAMRDALTPAQRQKLKEMMMERGQQWRPGPNVTPGGPRTGRRLGRQTAPPQPN
jgi:Spy/CpxP family protein refolding chaperone